MWNSNIDKTVKKFFRSSLQSCWVLQFSLFPRREGVMHMLSTLQTSYLIAGLCVSWVAKSMLSWAVSALLISISWQKWQHEKSIEMISDRLMDGFIFCKRSSEQTCGDFLFLHWFLNFQLVYKPFWSLLVSSRYPSLIISLLLQNNVQKELNFQTKFKSTFWTKIEILTGCDSSGIC